MKKFKYFLAMLLLLIVTASVIMYPNMYYTFFDRNIVDSEPEKGTYNFSRNDSSLSATQVYRLVTVTGSGVGFLSPVEPSVEEVERVLDTALTGFFTRINSSEDVSGILSGYYIQTEIDDYRVETICGEVDGEMLNLNLLCVSVKNDSAEYSVSVDMKTRLVYRFEVRNIYFWDDAETELPYWDDAETVAPVPLEYAEQELRDDLVKYWRLEDEDIISDIGVSVFDNGEMTVSITNIYNSYTY